RLEFSSLSPAEVPLVAAAGGRGAFDMRCHECDTKNTFACDHIVTCPRGIRRCLTLSIRLSSREIYVYKGCTRNCTFIYADEQPPPGERKPPRSNSLYFVQCCNAITCNRGGPINLEKDITPPLILEEELGGTVRLGEATLFLSVASVLVSHALT
uniref:UPAR/Ly6 domain-containing protein n=3 Tax=Sus scrofa TaxID=9823 RepID=A0A8D2C2K2_PIG